MKTRLRAAVLSAVAVVAAGLISTTTAAPAQAAEGKTCMDPIISGTIQRVVGESSTPLKPIYAEFQQSGYIEAACPAYPVDYRYKVTFTYGGRTVAAYNSELKPVYGFESGGWRQVATRIVFPTLRLNWDGYRNVNLQVTSGSKSVFSSTWCRSDEQSYDSTILVDSWAGYDTRTGTPRARVIACP